MTPFASSFASLMTPFASLPFASLMTPFASLLPV
jgi:hypothetical protein